MRRLSNLDRITSQFDAALRTAVGAGKRKPGFQHHHEEADLTDNARARSGELMRINHCGEVCAKRFTMGKRSRRKTIKLNNIS